MPNLLGTNPNQIGTNADHGSMAFQDENAVAIGGGSVQADLTGNSWNQNTDISTVQPTLRLDFDKMFSLDPRITFGRSGSPASYYDGKTFAVAEQNLVLYSQDFTQGWGKNAVTIAAGATLAPDGTMTGSKLQAIAGSNNFFNAQILIPSGTNLTYTLSIYAKQSSAQQYLYFGIGDDSSSRRGHIIVDLAAGSVTSTQQSTATVSSSSVTAAANGWWRIVMTISIVPAGNGRLQYGFVDASTAAIGTYGWYTFTATGQESAYVWGVQAEQRSAISAYTPTTSAAITNYIPQLMTAAANQARFDFDPLTGECKGLLVEEQRANLFTYSEQLDNAAYSKYRSSIIANCMVAPDGTLTADKIVESTAAADTHGCGQAFTFTAAAYAFSVYLKKGERSWVLLSASMGSAYFDLANGVIGTVAIGAASMQSVGNGWYRCSLYGMASAGASLNYMTAATGNGGYIYNGDGYSGFYAWGSQLEAGSFATSYIPTTSGQVTRTADTPQITGTSFSSFYNKSEGTWVVEATIVNPNGANRPMTYLHGTNGYPLYINSSNLVAIYDGNSASSSQSVAPNTPVKAASSYNLSTLSVCLSGGSVSSATPVGKFALADYLDIGFEATGNCANGWYKRLVYFPKRLTNAELVEMTI